MKLETYNIENHHYSEVVFGEIRRFRSNFITKKKKKTSIIELESHIIESEIRNKHNCIKNGIFMYIKSVTKAD